MNFAFECASRVLFGSGTFKDAPGLIRALGTRALVVTGRTDRWGLEESLLNHGLTTLSLRVTAEPSVDLIRQGTKTARREEPDVVVAVGGGSVLDAGKAVAALVANPGDPSDYLEVIGSGRHLSHPGLPCVAIPTTAGTGAETTRNSVLWDPESGTKVSLRSPFLLPKLALVDPVLTTSLPPRITAYSGLDALIQVLEAFVCVRRNPLVDGLCRQALPRAGRSLRRAYEAADDLRAREEMALLSLTGGVALTNAGLGAVHGIAGPLGGMLGASHGALCAALVAHVVEANLMALRQKGDPAGVLDRYDEAAGFLTGSPAARRHDLVEWLVQLCRDLEVPSLSRQGLTQGGIPEAVDKSMKASSMKGNPVALTAGEISEIVERAM